LFFFYFRSLFAFSVDNDVYWMYQHKFPVRIYKPKVRSTILNSFADLLTPRTNAQRHDVHTLTISLTGSLILSHFGRRRESSTAQSV